MRCTYIRHTLAHALHFDGTIHRAHSHASQEVSSDHLPVDVLKALVLGLITSSELNRGKGLQVLLLLFPGDVGLRIYDSEWRPPGRGQGARLE